MTSPLVVGVGASAGGVEALRSFFTAVPLDSGLAFVVYLHFPPHGTSHLVGILSHCTEVPVTSAAHGETILADHVYVVPPGALATFAGNRLSLTKFEHGHNPIDALFCSLANDFGERALGVVLSGTGSDGARGIEAISAHGGFTMAQADGGGSGHPEMPASAVATGLVDQVAPVEEIPAHLVAYGKALASGVFARHAEVAPHHLKVVKDNLCELLLSTARHDFSRYKASTFLRRVGRRMRVLRIPDWTDYVEHARRTPGEVVLLFRDLLIGVTAFFRDEEAFETLAARIVPRLFAGKGPQDKVRVWVAGCSTGEEAYSIAILLSEYAHTLPAPPQIQVFATDVDEDALKFARSGRYPAAALEGMREDRVRRFFIREADKFVASKELRADCTFALHSIIRDPPLCSIDMISCRNVLIYFDRRLQDQVIPTFHFALRAGGVLFLGPSEAVGQHTDLFSPVDKAGRIFERLGSARRSIPFLPPSRGKPASQGNMSLKPKPAAEKTVAQSVEAQIAKLYGPANVVVNGRGDIVHFSPRTGKYLEPIPGSPSQNLLAMARKELRISLRGALHEAKKTGQTEIRDDVAVELDPGVVQRVRVVVQPLEHDDDALWLVTFHDIGSVALVAEPSPKDPGATGAEMAIQHLERELLETRESLQSAIDEYEIAVEELRSSNEELMSMNDDLQASNEELEASKEELHVVNDELRMVNSELAGKIEELKLANGDLRNLFESTKLAVVFLDKDLTIRSFTHSVTEIFRLAPGDCGRRLTDIASFIDYDSLAADIATVLDTREAMERPVTRPDRGLHYLLRVIPYLTTEGRIDGVLVTLVNVTVAVEAQAQERFHRLLIAELNHRVKNILTVAGSLATQSLRGTTTPEDFATVFLGRLQALAKAQELLSDENWEAVPLRALIAAGLELQAEDKGRVSLDGPPVWLETKAATTISLAIHELATNATKYGAFANATGHVAIAWAEEMRPGGAILLIRWRESGGPPVRPPAKRGFGMQMIERGIKYELHGQATVDFLPGGIEALITIPLDGKSHASTRRVAEGQFVDDPK